MSLFNFIFDAIGSMFGSAPENETGGNGSAKTPESSVSRMNPFGPTMGSCAAQKSHDDPNNLWN